MKVMIDGVEYVPRLVSSHVVPMGTLFFRARQKLQRTQQQVADGCGFSLNTVFNAEAGRMISLPYAIRLCRYYGIDMETLADSIELQFKEK